MNRVVLAGYLADDPKALNSANNAFVGVRIVIATKDSRDRGNDVTHFLNCVAWSNVASYVQRNLKRGDFVVADGRVRVNKFVNNEGKNVSRIEIVIDAINSPGSRRNSNGVTQQFTTKELSNIDNAFPDTIDIDLNLDEAFSLQEVSNPTIEVDEEKNNVNKENDLKNDLPWSDDLEN